MLSESHSVMSDSLWPHGLYSPQNSAGHNTGVDSHSLLQEIFPTQRSNPGLPALQEDSLPAEPQGKPKNTGMGRLSLLQHIFPTQELNQGFLHCRRILYQLSCQGNLSLCLFNLYAEYIMWNGGLDEAQAGIKIAWRNKNLRCADDITLMAESEEELKSVLMRVKGESEKAGLQLNIQKIKIMACGWQVDGEIVEAVTFYFLGLQNHCGWWLQP